MIYGNRDLEPATILIVDDVESNRLILEEIIISMGCASILAESGEKALEMIQKHAPQLVLTDISMPGMDGYELCRMIKGNEVTKHIPVIFISAFDHPEDIVEGLSYGGEDYITKPFVPEVIEARVGVHLRLDDARRKLVEMNRRLQVSVSEQLKQMEMEKRNVLYALANIVAKHSDYKKEYMERIKHNCRILAQGMQLSPQFEGRISDALIDAIEISAPLCDIGNIGIPPDILHKRDGLSEEESAVLRTHPLIGAQFLCDLYAKNESNDFIGTALDMVRSHHESWDGSGYPDGLSGEAIPLAAQIVSMMEAYCALTDGSCSREGALEAMREDVGRKLNPDIFDICCKISRQFC